MSAIFSSWRFKNIVDVLGDSLNMQRRGIAGQPLGQIIADIIAYSIIQQVDKAMNPQGQRLPKLSKSWLAWKTVHGKNPAILHEDNLMMDFRQVRGMVVVSKDAMSMFYGITGAEIDKAFYAQEGAKSHGMPGLFGWHRPPREFYDLNKETWNRVDQYLDAEIDSVIQKLGGMPLP